MKVKRSSRKFYINTKIILDFLQEKGLNKTQFAGLCKISTYKLRKVLRGELNCLNAFELVRILDTLDCSSVALLGV